MGRMRWVLEDKLETGLGFGFELGLGFGLGTTTRSLKVTSATEPVIRGGAM